MSNGLDILRFAGVTFAFVLMGASIWNDDFAEATFWLVCFYAGVYGPDHGE